MSICAWKWNIFSFTLISLDSLCAFILLFFVWCVCVCVWLFYASTWTKTCHSYCKELRITNGKNNNSHTVKETANHKSSVHRERKIIFKIYKNMKYFSQKVFFFAEEERAKKKKQQKKKTKKNYPEWQRKSGNMENISQI